MAAYSNGVPKSAKTVSRNNSTNSENGLENGPKIGKACLDFDSTFDYLIDDISSGFYFKPNEDNQPTEDSQASSDAKEWLRKVLQYNVPLGKKFRGRLVELAFKGFVQNPDEEMLKCSRILGWCVEMLQACFLVADDLMDNGQTRRGQPCWHLVDGKGNAAINDVYLLEHSAYQVIIKYFKHLPCYTEILELVLGNTFKTIIGQSLDTRASLENEDPSNKLRFENYSMELYNSIVRYKTSYYTCFLPVALAMSLAGISRENRPLLWNHVERATLEIGHLFQVQDDYFDCFADEAKLGKVGMDIQEGKCSWLFVTAKELLKDNPKTYSILVENYGKSDPIAVQKVKDIYNQLELPQKFEDDRIYRCRNIVELIRKLNHPNLENVLNFYFDVIYKRTH